MTPSKSKISRIDATIANGQSLSGAVNLGNRVVVGLLMPATWTAADLTFQASIDGTTYADMYDIGGNEVTAVADASQYIAISPSLWAGALFLKVRSGTTGTPVNQGGARDIVLVGRDLD